MIVPVVRIWVFALTAALLPVMSGCTAGHLTPRALAGPTPPASARPAATKKARWAIPAFPPAPTPVPITIAPGDRVPYLHAVPTTQKVAFLTIDDGFTKVPEAPELIAAAHVPVTLFLTIDAVKDNPDFFRPMQQSGAVIEAHTITHNELRGRSYDYQKREICGSADQLGKWYGRRPVLFRPPFGDKDATTLRASHDCGMTADFMWKATVDKGIVRYQEGHTLKPGDIVLMHFRPAFVKDFLAALRAIHQAGLTPALLDDYMPTQTPTAR
jgi:peptidoglycan/xylan/chitin deacetylase (PgdA/CDA1 family)